MPDRQRSRSEIATLILLTATPSSAKAENAASDPTVMKRSKSTLWGVIMMRCRLLILIAVLAIPLSLIAGPAVQAASAQGVSTAVVTPASGLAGSTVTGSGSNWTAGDHIQAYWSDNNSTLGGEVVVAPDGTFTDPGLKIPTGVASGSHQILFSDVEGRYFETASFDVTGTSPTPPPSSCSAPSVSLTPSAGPVGSQFVMKGAGWISGGVVHITLPYGSKGIFGAADATPTVSAGGAWQTTVTVGKSPAGSYTFTFAETGCTSQTGTFKVTASPPTCPPAPQPRIYWSQLAGPQGARISLTGNGWYANDAVTIHLPSEGTFYVSRTSWLADSAGDWQLNITVGDQTPPGSYELSFTQSACGGLKVVGDFKVNMTAGQYITLASAVYQIASAGNAIAKIVGGKAWSATLVSEAVSVVDKALQVFYEVKAGYEGVILGKDLKAFRKALAKAHGNTKDPAVRKAAMRVGDDDLVLWKTLLAIVPGLDFILPSPAS